jgi:hypothetical protein
MAKFPEPKLFRPLNPNKYAGDPTKIVCRSGIEKRYMKYFDEASSILKWGSEEIVIPYQHPVDKKVHRYFPDFIIKLKDKTGKIKVFIVEIKHSSDTIKPVKGKKQVKRFLTEAVTWEVNNAKWAAAKAWAAKRKIEFIVLTEREIQNKW